MVSDSVYLASSHRCQNVKMQFEMIRMLKFREKFECIIIVGAQAIDYTWVTAIRLRYTAHPENVKKIKKGTGFDYRRLNLLH